MNFNISTLERNSDDGVVVAHWQVNKAEGENVASLYGTVSFTPDPSAESYVAYADLTEETVIGWVQAAIDTEALEASLDADLAEQASPSIITGTPW
jgi:roadblock/LC7 domain-containing protein